MFCNRNYFGTSVFRSFRDSFVNSSIGTELDIGVSPHNSALNYQIICEHNMLDSVMISDNLECKYLVWHVKIL